MRSNRVLRSEIKATKCIVFFDELHDYNVKLPETSQLHILWRKYCLVFLLLTFFLTAPIFTLVASSTSHFLTAAIKFSCYSSNVIGLLCLLSLALALSVINTDINIKSKERIAFVVVVVLVAVRFTVETREYFRYNILLPPTG